MEFINRDQGRKSEIFKASREHVTPGRPSVVTVSYHKRQINEHSNLPRSDGRKM